MEITSGVKYRLHPNEQQAQILSQWIGCQRFIYNAKVGEDRYFRTFARKSLSLAGILPPVDQRYSQFITDDTAFLRGVPSQILRNGAYRWMTGYQRFFKGLAGRPVHRNKNGRQSVLITSELFAVNVLKDEIILGTGKYPLGAIPYTRHGERCPVPKSICIARHAGKWWLSFNFTQEHEVQEEPLTEKELVDLFRGMAREELLAITIGGDRGVTIPLATSEGIDFDFDLVTKNRMQIKERNRRRYQRRLERQHDGSKRKFRAKQQIDRTYEYQANVRKDYAHKTSRKLVDSPAQIIAFEDLQIRNMTRRPKAKRDESGKFVRNGAAAKAGLNRSILGAGWGNLVTYTTYKGLRKSKLTIKVKPNGTSQECSRCGHTHPDNRVTQALFICQSCGLEINADLNASINIKVRGVEKILSPDFASRQKKTVRFRKVASTRDGTPEVKRASKVSAEEGPGTIAGRETAVSRRRVRPLAQESVNRETPTTTLQLHLLQKVSGG